MNKYAKVGLSALCGSLACIASANAGALDVSGTAEATWTQKAGSTTGNPLGMNTGLTFTGSGELDGGQTFEVSIAHTDKATYSSANISLTTNTFGTFKLSQAEGSGGIGGYDDNMPRAWEEVWDTGIATNANFQKGVGSSTNISWTSPKVAGISLILAMAPDNDGAQNNNKAVSAEANNKYGMGYDIVLDINPSTENFGWQWFNGYSHTDVAEDRSQSREDADVDHLSGDHEEVVSGMQLTLGPMVIGGQVSAERIQTVSYNAIEYYGNKSYGIAFNINDNLSVSYAEARHVAIKTKKRGSGVSGENVLGVLPASWKNNNVGGEHLPKSWMRGDSFQIAYTIGGVGLKYSDSNYDNTAYGFDTKAPQESRIIAVSLAF